MAKTNYNNMYRSNFKKEEPKKVFEEILEVSNEEDAPVEESAVEEASFEEVKEEEMVEEIEEVEEVIEEVVEPKVEEPLETKLNKFGRVTGGLSLNVRQNPGGKVIKVIHNGEKVTIEDDSDNEWYKISEPVAGFVMKKFINEI